MAIAPRRLIALAHQIKPVFHDRESDQLCFMTPVDVETMSFIWSPEIAAPALDLTPLKHPLRTQHSYSHSLLFKPSMAEVYETIDRLPKKSKEKIVAFSTQPYSDNLIKLFTPDMSKHWGVTTLYMGNIPEIVAAQPVLYKGQAISNKI